MTLGEAMRRGRDNNVGNLRLFLAGAVVTSHAWPLALGEGVHEPLSDLTGRSLGFWAVIAFFFLSGLFISESAANRSTKSFWTSRARRILPGLVMALIVTVILAVLSGARPGLLTGAEYVVRNTLLASIEHRIDGAFASNPYPEMVNGPLWSLFNEVTAYVLCYTAARLGLLQQRGGTVLILVAAALLAAVDGLPPRLDAFGPLFLAFAMGMAVWQFRDDLPLDWRIVALLSPLVLFGWAGMLVPFAYVLVLVSWKVPGKSPKTDLSYGVYLYGWPVAQFVLFLVPGLTPVELAIMSMIAVLPFAAASWYLVEHPSIRRKVVVA